MLEEIVTTGCKSIDEIIGGGLKPENTILIYGEAETGKTSLAMQCIINSALLGYKNLYIDSERNFSTIRLKQLSLQNFIRISKSIILIRLETFKEQSNLVDHFEKYIDNKSGLVIFDTINSLYRLETRDMNNTFKLNRELNLQIATLLQIIKISKMSLLLLSQVRSSLDSISNSIEPVATRVLKYWADYSIELTKTKKNNIIRARIQNNNEIITRYLIIKKDGIYDYNR